MQAMKPNHLLFTLLWLPGVPAAAAEGVGQRPYELDWAGRTEDAQPPLVDFENIDGWRAECRGAVAAFEPTREQPIWGRQVGKLTYRATDAAPEVRVLPPAPVAIARPFDAVSLWVHGNNWGWAPDPNTPPVRLAALFQDAQAQEFVVPLHSVNWTEWHLVHQRLSPEQVDRVKSGARFKGLLVTNGTNAQDRTLYFDNLAVFAERFPPLEFEPRPERGIPMFPGQAPGANTGPGKLPFPATTATILPHNAVPSYTNSVQPASNAAADGYVFTYDGTDGRLVYRYRPESGTWSDIGAEWTFPLSPGSPPAARPGLEIRPCVGGGVYLATDGGPVPPEKAEHLSTVGAGTSVESRWRLTAAGVSVEVTCRYRMKGKSLLLEVLAPGGNLAEVRSGRAVGLTNPRLVTNPFYPAEGGRPAVVVSDPANAPLFLAGNVDWYVSNGSVLWATPSVSTNGAVYHGGTRYIPCTDGRRNACFERFIVTLAPRYEELLPQIPNPPSPWRHITGTRLWRAHGAGNREQDRRYWEEVHRHGMTQLVVTDHETMWRDGGESFTFRTRAAPGKGGDAGARDYSRFMQDTLGFVYGPYNNYTDFAPVNEFWSPDLVSRDPRNQLQQLHSRYCLARATEIRYATADGQLLDTSQAVARGDFRRSQVVTRYADGTITAANGSTTERLTARAFGRDLDLPPNGYAGWTEDGAIDVLSSDPAGHRADCAVTPAYLYADGRGRFTRFANAASNGPAVCRVLPDGQHEIIPLADTECGFAVPAAQAVALDKQGKELGPAAVRSARGLTYVTPVKGAFSYRLSGTATRAEALNCPRDAVVAGERVTVLGRTTHEVTIPADAQAGARLWFELAGGWIDFTVVPPAEPRRENSVPSAPATATPSPATIATPHAATPLVHRAAREVRRYFFLRTGTLLPLMEEDGKAATTAPTIRLGLDPALGKSAYRLRTAGPVLTISGGDEVGVLYGAYALAERLGVRFQLDGDVLPDDRVPPVLPALDETHAPLFERRGLVPFHDFPEGPDWWTTEDWKAVVGQVAKLRMNFVGLHTYPFQNKDLGPEPTVWVGLPEDVNADGTVRRSDVTTWYNTRKYQPYGCYRPEKTGAFSFGGAAIFPADNYGSEVNRPDDFPFPKTPAACAALVDRAGRMLREVFTAARGLGIQTCVGTESPLDIPDAVKARLAALGMKPEDPGTVRAIYEGMFTRIARAYPIDYYWIWGHEGEIDPARFLTNLACARDGLAASGARFGLAICGWGWITQNFPALDLALPRDVAFSAISMSVGNDPLSTNFARLPGRATWAIPWLEDDPGLSSPQLWVGRLRRDAVDARAYGCAGLMGLHWRTRILGPNIAALAQAAWEQGQWSRTGGADKPRFLAVGDFYADWARAQFGSGVGPAAGAIFAGLDGKFPRASTWNQGPGVIVVDRRPWAEVSKQYGFVESFAALRPNARGAAQLDRFDWWLNTFRCARAMAQAGCVRGALDGVMERIGKLADPAEQRRMARDEALPLREQLLPIVGDMYAWLLATLNNSSELGAVVNIEQQSLLRTRFLDIHDARLERLLAQPLPASTRPWKEYRGPARLAVLTARGWAERGQALPLPIVALDRQPVRGVAVLTRPLGRGEWRRIEARVVARAVYQASLPPASEDFEYYAEAQTAGGGTLRWPASAPGLNQTVVVAEGTDRQ
jgi:hypothetical protein